MDYSTLISTSVLESHLAHPSWVLVDCRFDLNQPDWGRANYLQGHIPGAVYAHLAKDLSGSDHSKNGRHPLPDQQEFIRHVSSWGIDQNKQVIAYVPVEVPLQRDYGASSVLWASKCAVLDGGYTKWVSEGHPVNIGNEIQNPSILKDQWINFVSLPIKKSIAFDLIRVFY